MIDVIWLAITVTLCTALAWHGTNITSQHKRKNIMNAVTIVEESQLSITDLLVENLGGATISKSDLVRVTVPAGGATNWEVPGLDGGADAFKALEGVILQVTTERILWPPKDPAKKEKEKPLCKSNNGLIGTASELAQAQGMRGGECKTCPFNKWGSGKAGKGKACQEKAIIYLLRYDIELLPLVVSIPAGSLSALNKFRVAVTNRRLTFQDLRVKLSLEKTENSTGDPFSRVVFSAVDKIDDMMRAELRVYRSMFADMLASSHDEGMTDEEFMSNTPVASATATPEPEVSF